MRGNFRVEEVQNWELCQFIYRYAQSIDSIGKKMKSQLNNDSDLNVTWLSRGKEGEVPIDPLLTDIKKSKWGINVCKTIIFWIFIYILCLFLQFLSSFPLSSLILGSSTYFSLYPIIFKSLIFSKNHNRLWYECSKIIFWFWISCEIDMCYFFFCRSSVVSYNRDGDRFIKCGYFLILLRSILRAGDSLRLLII